MSNFYKLNKDYIKTFQIRMMNRYREQEKRTETSLFQALLDEINELFRKVGSRSASKKDIPEGSDYPDSKVYNKLINDIGFDIDKLFNAQKVIESDINNLINFNSNQRIKTFGSLASAQQEVYSVYTKANRDTIGGMEIPAGNPFTSPDNIDPESEDVSIDRGILTLACTSKDSRNIDVLNTTVYFAGKLPQRPIYPAGDTLGVGSHWKTTTTDPHFIDSSNPSSVEQYKAMMVDDPNNSVGIGFCEFEAVRTNTQGYVEVTSVEKMRLERYKYGLTFVPVTSEIKIENSAVNKLKNYIGSKYGKDPELLNIDLVNSLQGKYVLSHPLKYGLYRSTSGVPQYKLVIPIVEEVLTNEIIIDLAANGSSFIPKINLTESKVYSKISGGEVAYSFVLSSDGPLVLSDDGKYSLRVSSFVIPTRLELILQYDNDELMWTPIDFYMSHYVYSDSKTYEMPFYGNSKVNIVINKTYDIFVDTEADITKEKERALNVLKSQNRSGL